MPLRDHFRPPTSKQASWEEIHATWPITIVQHLKGILPKGFVSAPKVHLGAFVEIDIAAFEKDATPIGLSDADTRNGGIATLPWAPPTPSVAVETDLPDYDEYEVRVYDAERDRQLVAAIEIVSPSNKDRPEARRAFVDKCAALLRKGIAVSIVDVITIRHANLYIELLESLRQTDPSFAAEPVGIYASSCRWLLGERRAKLETWSHILTVGQPLPTLPIWLTPQLAVPLDLERCYEKACDDLSVT